MENLAVDTNKLEEELRNTPDPNPKTWYNEGIIKKVLNTLIALEISIIGLCMFVGNDIGFGFDWVLFVLGQKLVAFPVIIVAFKVASDDAVMKAKKEVEAKNEVEKKALNAKIDNQNREIIDLNKKCAENDKEIFTLKLVLDAKAQNIDALRDASNLAEKVEEMLKK